MTKQDDNGRHDHKAVDTAKITSTTGVETQSIRKQAQGQPKVFKRLDQVLNQVISKLGLDRRLKEHTFINLWPTLVGEPWSERSRGLFIDVEGNLVVAVSDAATGQELSFLKPKIIQKLKMAAKAVGLNIQGLRFDLKHFHNNMQNDLEIPRQATQHKLPEPSEQNLDQVILSADELAMIEQLKQSLSLNESSVGIADERILAVFELDLRIKSWRRGQGYPICVVCQSPVSVFSDSDKEILCVLCACGGAYESGRYM